MKTAKQAEQTIREMATLSKRTAAREAVRDLRYGDNADAVEAIEAVGESRAVAIWAQAVVS